MFANLSSPLLRNYSLWSAISIDLFLSVNGNCLCVYVCMCVRVCLYYDTVRLNEIVVYNLDSSRYVTIREIENEESRTRKNYTVSVFDASYKKGRYCPQLHDQSPRSPMKS